MTKFYTLKTLAFALILAITPFFSKAQIDLLQTTDNSISTAPIIVGCVAENVGTFENEFARSYNLNELGFSSFEVTKVTFGIQLFTPQTSSGVEVEVRVYASNGGTNSANLAYQGGGTIMVEPEMQGSLVEVELNSTVVVNTSEMVVSVRVPSLVPISADIMLGGNSNGQTMPGFLRGVAPDCGITEFTNYDELGFPDAHLVLFPTGNPTLICPPGNVYLASQAEVNQFGMDYPTCTHINGILQVQADAGTSDVTDLSPLSNLVSVSQALQLNNNTFLTDLSGMSNMVSVGGLSLFNNGFTNLDGFASLANTDEGIYIAQNPNLTNLNALSSLTSLPAIIIDNNSVLNDISGIQDATSLSINPEVGVTITNNPSLAVCNLPNICEYIANDPNTHARNISGNLAECLDEEAVINACNGPTEGCTDAPYGQYPESTFTPTCTNAPEVITNQAWTGEYSIVELSDGMQYTFSSSIASDYITITDEAGENVLLYGEGSISAFAEGTAAIRFYLHNNDQCESEQVERSRIIQCGLVSVDELTNPSLTCYPNPAKDLLNLSYSKNMDRIEVLNILGQIVMIQSVNSEIAQLDISSLPSGNYVVKAISEGTVLTTKMVKQ